MKPGKTRTSATIDRLEEAFKALADRTRLRILALLGNNEVCVCHIHDSLGLPQPTVSRHLAYLRRSGLVSARRDGVWMHYQVSRSLDPAVQHVVAAAVEALGHVPSTTRIASSSAGRSGICTSWTRAMAAPVARRAGKGTSVVIERARASDLPAVFRPPRIPSPAGRRSQRPRADNGGGEERTGLVGVAALELYADGALLRSVAVDRAFRAGNSATS